MALRETDILTGLYTQGFMVAFGARELSFARENGYPVSLIAFAVESDYDFDRPDETDIVTEEIRHVGQLIRKAAGDGSIVARMNDHEMAVLLPGVGEDKAVLIAEQITKIIENRLSDVAPPTVSAGVASTKGGNSEFGDLLKAAREQLKLRSRI